MNANDNVIPIPGRIEVHDPSQDTEDDRVEFATVDQCNDTKHGWLWYCDGHNAHGIARTGEEAEHVGRAHREFVAATDDPTPCALVVWQRRYYEKPDGAHIYSNFELYWVDRHDAG